MKARNIGLIFHVDVSASKPWFHIPKSIAELFSLKPGDLLAVSISSPKGEPIYHGFAKLDSATRLLVGIRHLQSAL